MEFQFELFHILKDESVKVLHSICQQMWKTEQWPQDWKRSVFIPIPKKGNAAEDGGSTPGLGRFPVGGNGNPLQYSCLENPMDRGDWQANL